MGTLQGQKLITPVGIYSTERELCLVYTDKGHEYTLHTGRKGRLFNNNVRGQ